ncbi:hypothetical protein V5T82_03650 [Magnetovibrio sp. PR-2]|uniref:hypothetical protein n=1 Tax=Magnetovibrio sp. PR-2 TaxID=3120356 RepID=UPI002FCE03D2
MPFGTFSKDMQLTRPEFEKRLSKDVAGFRWRMTPNGAEGEQGPQKVVIELKELEPRRIAMIVLPRCQVEFSFEGMDEGDTKAFIHKFDQVFQKGGG